ncbi:hypothetical protein F5884DRAFT_547756 [Xylogone sp. PMI_703]|nr:hypothetical protein F5884DRAFT_547756 [Xylogone sp. PMI_703]
MILFQFFFLVAIASICLASSGCKQVDLYVNPNANATLGLLSNGSSPDTPFANVFDAEARVKELIANGGDSQQVIVNLAPGIYPMTSHLRLNGLHSGSSQCPCVWQAPDGEAILSGATRVQGWSIVSAMPGVYVAQVPFGSKTRALYVDGVSMPRARVAMSQSDSVYTPNTFQNDGTVDFSTVSKVQYVEIRSVGTFFDRYSGVDFLQSDGKTLVMKQPAWYRNMLGSNPFQLSNVLGLFAENSLSFLDEEGEWYLDVETNELYYKPVGGKHPDSSEIYLPHLEVVLAVSGFTHATHAHDIQIRNISFAHTTWNLPSTEYGYPDQQTGAFIGERWNRSEFEAFRPHWYMTPGAVQVSAADRISFVGGSVSMTGAAGLSVGNDNNAHISDIGLGAKYITITGMNFTQTGGNSLQVGGIGPDGHHPIVPAVENSYIVATHNTFKNNARIFTSAASIFFTYVANSEITSNTIINTPYSAICFGFGWGSNDPGGTARIAALGTYNYQPVYETPTTAHDNLLSKNYMYHVGFNHTDEGGMYFLSMNNRTRIEGNVVLNSLAHGIYFDEGSRYMTASGNVVDAIDDWVFLNFESDTGNETIINNYGTTDNNINPSTDEWGDYFNNNVYFNRSLPWPSAAIKILNAAGAEPFNRTNLTHFV